ncbi:SUKH-4 family immunity protein [Streptomyces sp. NRRL WC-3742]|uniref:SUKH-4 family immunity protein n=1 Tax=Streptomyces sp. NRRL WC-3742 TaxID=1463934 RepID=UPI0004C5DCBF|nr:SUKH-4 family immunity protein [Streptomyces sp. NRRL WC-3742]
MTEVSNGSEGSGGVERSAGSERSAAGDERRLPAVLTHGPSREWLAAGGLPRVIGHLDLTASGAEELLTVDAWFEAAPAGGAERLVVLGETCYDAEDAWAPAAVAVDGTSGEVVLVIVDDDGGVRRDRLATDVWTLTSLLGQVEAVTDQAGLVLDPRAEGFIPRGPAAVARIARVAGGSLRETDPELFRHWDDRPPHWDTAVGIRALGWAALPGEGLAYALDAALVEELAELTGCEVRRYAEDDLPAQLSHGPSRRLLTELGLPVGGSAMFVADAEGPLPTMAECYPDSTDEEDGSERPYQAGFLVLSEWTYDLTVLLDGATGRVELSDWGADGELAAYLHGDLSALLLTLWTYERLRAARDRESGPWAVFSPGEMYSGAAEDMLRALDPKAWATEDHFWPLLADDGHMGELLD